ncbi:hypothetical protein A2U01_0051060, partial [Trifolium medium]|nr:hypothetical protein [Trifolium medium]
MEGILSGSCASRSLVWRGAPLNQVVENDPLEVARRAGWFGATPRFKNSNYSDVTANCALRRADGAARRYGKLCRFLHSIVQEWLQYSFSLISSLLQPSSHEFPSSHPILQPQNISHLQIAQKSLPIDSTHPLLLKLIKLQFFESQIAQTLTVNS